MKTIESINAEFFQLGKIVATVGVVEILLQHPDGMGIIAELVERHARKDWAHMEQDEIDANAMSIVDGAQILSKYTVDGQDFHVITEGENPEGVREYTNILLADEN